MLGRDFLIPLASRPEIIIIPYKRQIASTLQANPQALSRKDARKTAVISSSRLCESGRGKQEGMKQTVSPRPQMIIIPYKKTDCFDAQVPFTTLSRKDENNHLCKSSPERIRGISIFP